MYIGLQNKLRSFVKPCCHRILQKNKTATLFWYVKFKLYGWKFENDQEVALTKLILIRNLVKYYQHLRLFDAPITFTVEVNILDNFFAKSLLSDLTEKQQISSPCGYRKTKH